MFGMGIQEIVMIAVIALIFVGPDKLPGVLKQMAGWLKEVRKVSDEIKDSVMIDINEPSDNWQKRYEKQQRQLNQAQNYSNDAFHQEIKEAENSDDKADKKESDNEQNSQIEESIADKFKEEIEEDSAEIVLKEVQNNISRLSEKSGESS